MNTANHPKHDLSVDLQGPRPHIEDGYNACVSWKAADKGRKWTQVKLNPSNTLSIRAMEIPEGGRGTKETFTDLSEESTRILFEILRRRFAP